MNLLPGMFLIVDNEQRVVGAFGDGWRGLGADASVLVGTRAKELKTGPFKARLVRQCMELGDPLTVVTPINERQWECVYVRHTEGLESPIVVCSARDKTEEMRVDGQTAEATFEINAKARARSLQALSMAVAHEINNPITIIHGHTMAARQAVAAGNAPADKLATHFDAVERNVARVVKIVHSLRDIGNDGSEEPVETFEIETAARAGIDQATRHSEPGDIAITCDCATTQPRFRGRRLQLVHAIEQLVVNAIEAVRPLSTRWVKIAISDGPKGHIITVTDSGGGIPLELAHKIMVPFFTTRPVGKGSGIGLNIAKRNIEANGGALTLDRAQPNTCFVIELPSTT